jgi:hypothetical protein
MDNAEKNILIKVASVYRKGLLKRLEAIKKHHACKEKFVNKRERIIQEIEEARLIWKDTMAQLPKNEFQEF